VPPTKSRHGTRAAHSDSRDAEARCRFHARLSCESAARRGKMALRLTLLSRVEAEQPPPRAVPRPGEGRACPSSDSQLSEVAAGRQGRCRTKPAERVGPERRPRYWPFSRHATDVRDSHSPRTGLADAPGVCATASCAGKSRPGGPSSDATVAGIARQQQLGGDFAPRGGSLADCGCHRHRVAAHPAANDVPREHVTRPTVDPVAEGCVAMPRCPRVGVPPLAGRRPPSTRVLLARVGEEADLLIPPGSTGPAGTALERSSQYVMPTPVTSARIRYTQAGWRLRGAMRLPPRRQPSSGSRSRQAQSACAGRNRGLVVGAG
jgi:hypothetical protein